MQHIVTRNWLPRIFLQPKRLRNALCFRGIVDVCQSKDFRIQSHGLLFGWQIGAPATIIAATLGATLLFLIARTSLGETLAARALDYIRSDLPTG